MNYLVTVVIPTYKRANRLSNAIDSVLNQSYSNIEVVVVDDNSDGDIYRRETEKIMDQYILDTRIKYIKHVENMNGSAARNTGLLNSSGDFICFLDDDDFFYKDKIDMQLSFLIKNDLDAVCVGFEFYNGDKVYKQSLFSNRTGRNILDLLSGRIIFGAGSTLMIKRDVIEELSGFDKSYVRHQDWEFMMRIFDKYKFDTLDRYLVGLNTDGLRNYPDPKKFLETKEKFLNEFEDQIYRLPKKDRRDILSYQWSEVMVYFFRDKQISNALDIYIKKIIIDAHRLQTKQFIKGVYYYLENYIPKLKTLKYEL